MQVSIITIGDELLIGQVIDTNSAWIAEQLNQIGIRVHEIITISDHHENIIDTINYCREKSNLIILTGGLGPTRDDITKAALSDYIGTKMEYYPKVYNQIEQLFKQINKPIDHIIMEQCYFPSGTIIVDNALGTAPGMWIQNDDLTLFSMPGVPYEMKYIMENGGLGKIKELFPKLNPILHRTIKTAVTGEDRIAKLIDDIVDDFPKHLKIAYLPSLWEVRIRISGNAATTNDLNSEINYYESLIVNRLGNIVYGYDKDTLSSVVGKLLLQKGLTISTAESCTAGLIGHTIASTANCSAYYQGSVVSYSNEIKQNVLKVKAKTLEKYGAVSEQCVIEMLIGILSLHETDVGIAISGIAGPSGGTSEKPVGTTWIAYGKKENIKVKKVNIGRDRIKNMQIATTVSLNLMRLYLEEL